MIIIILLILHCVIPPWGCFWFLISVIWPERAPGLVFVFCHSFDGFVLSWHSVKLQCKNKCELFLSGGKEQKCSFVVLNTYSVLQKTQNLTVYFNSFSWARLKRAICSSLIVPLSLLTLFQLRLYKWQRVLKCQEQIDRPWATLMDPLVPLSWTLITDTVLEDVTFLIS